MTIQQLRGALPAIPSRRTACPSVVCLMLLVLTLVSLPALAGAQQTCQADGDVDRSGSVTAADALLVFQQALSLIELSMCEKSIADVFPQPHTPDGNITASDALCIFQKALSLPSCLDSVLPPNEAPMANAGPDQSVGAGEIVILSDTASDPDGAIASYLWEQTGGMMVEIVGAGTAFAFFTAPDVSADETLTFRLTVTDNDGAQASDEMSVTIMAVESEGFVSVGAGSRHTCGVRDTGEVECWGNDTAGQSTPPAGNFFSVSAGGSHTCGVRDTGEVECWGYSAYGPRGAPRGTFVSFSAGADHTCGVRDTGEVECWGDDQHGESTPPRGIFASVSAGISHTCGVLRAGTVQCWGNDTVGQSTPPAGTYFSVSAGGNHTCGVRDTGEVECWG